MASIDLPAGIEGCRPVSEAAVDVAFGCSQHRQRLAPPHRIREVVANHLGENPAAPVGRDHRDGGEAAGGYGAAGRGEPK